MFTSKRTTDRTTTGRRARRIAVRTVAPVLLIALAPTTVGATPAQSVSSLQDKAAKIAAELDRLDERESVLAEEQNAAQLELETLQQQLAQTEADYSAAQAEMGSTRDAAAEYARQAYVGNTGNSDPLSYLANDNVQDESARRAYMSSNAGASSDSLETLQASEQVLGAQKDQLDAARAAVEQKTAQIEQSQTDLQASIAEREALQKSVNSDLEAAVAAEQERLRKAAEEKAAAEARAAAACAAAAARTSGAVVSRAPSTSASASTPSTSGNSAGSTTTAPTQVKPAPAAPSVPSGGTAAGQAAVAKALTQLGVPYKWAGASPAGGFDCSGLVMWAYAGNKSLPHSSRSLRSMSTSISESQLVPGDLVFGGSPVHHVGIYIGNGQMVHAPRTGDVVKISGIYASSKPVSFGRLP